MLSYKPVIVWLHLIESAKVLNYVYILNVSPF